MLSNRARKYKSASTMYMRNVYHRTYLSMLIRSFYGTIQMFCMVFGSKALQTNQALARLAIQSILSFMFITVNI